MAGRRRRGDLQSPAPQCPRAGPEEPARRIDVVVEWIYRVFWREGDDQSPPVQPACEPMQTPNWSQKMTPGEELNNFIVDNFPMVKPTSLVSLRVCEEDWNGDSDW